MTVSGPSLRRLTLERLEARDVPAALLGLTAGNALLAFDSATPQTITSTVSVTGLQANENLLGIDYRPATGDLFGLGSTSRLYRINPTSGAATQVGTAGAFTLQGTSFGFDFNPTVDRIRVVSNTGQNLRLNPDTGALAATDANLAYAAGDVNAGQTPTAVGSAYTNNVPNATTTTLFNIDSGRDVLVSQIPPNAGTLNTVGALGFDAGPALGFDILTTGAVNSAFAVFANAGGAGTNLYTINTTTGAAAFVGPVGTTPVSLTGLAAVLPRPATAAGASTVGGFDATTATWYLRSANSAGAPTFTPFQYGAPGWKSVIGDWDNNNTDTVGAVDPSGKGPVAGGATNLVWYLRNTNSAGAADFPPFVFGDVTWTPIVGDWDGDGRDTIGAYDPKTATFYLRNTNSAGAADFTFQYGAPGWLPVVGNWDGVGSDSVGVVDPTGTGPVTGASTSLVWYLRNSNSAGAADFTPFAYGDIRWTPVAGDWNADGRDTVGVADNTGGINPSDLIWYLRNSNNSGAPDVTPFAYGARQWNALVGDYV